MRLEMGTFPVTDTAFDRTTRYDAGRLMVDREAVLAAVRQDSRIATAELEIARPGESVRIWPVRDVIEPRVKVEGPGVCYPGICGRDIATVGEGRTHRLAGMGVGEVSSVNLHDARGDYVLPQLTPPWYLHPNEILDGALTGPYRTAFAMSWTVANNPLLSDLYRRHGRDWNFLGVISLRTEWTTQTEKQLMANQTAKLARQLGAQGAVVTWDAGGNEFIEVVRSIQACERLGIKTVFLTSEDDATDGAPTMLEPLPEADAIVSTSFFKNVTLAVPEAPAVARVIGLPTKTVRRGSTVGLHGGADAALPTAGPPPPPWRYDDHHGFNSLSCIEEREMLDR